MAMDGLEMELFRKSLADSIETIRQFQDRDHLSTLYSVGQVDQWMEETKRFVQTHPVDELDKLLTSESNVPDQLGPFLAHISNIIKKPRITDVGGRIGSGGFGHAFRGMCKVYNTTTEVALKTAQQSTDSEVRAKYEKAFEEEANNLKEFAHLFVVKFFGVCQFNDHKYIVMDLCTGSLKGYVEGNPRDLVMANSRMILGQVALAINYLHGKNMIHKDLKPENILYKETDSGWPHILLCDFGNTRQLRPPLTELLASIESDPQGLDAGAFKKTVNQGTAGYIAPELLKKGLPTFKSDVWAMGAVVFFVVSGGQHPYEFVEIDQPSRLNDFIKFLKCPPNVSQLKDLNAADLICRLMISTEKLRPDMSVVMTHPFFWADNPSATTHFVVKVNDFFTSNRDRTELASKLSELLNEEKLRAWYDTLDDQLKTDEVQKDLNSLHRIVKSIIKDRNDFDQAIAFNVDSRIKKQLEAGLSSGARIKEMKDPLVTDLLRLLDTAPILFGLFIWHTVSRLVTKSTGDKFFTDSELAFALFHCPVEFYKHLAQVSTWSLGLAKEQLSIAATLPTADALCYLLSDGCAGRDFITQAIKDFRNGIQNPLHVAAYCSTSEKVIETLIEALGDVDLATDERWTALHHAASHNANHQIVAKLLEFNADIHLRDGEDWTPLHHAARYNTNVEITRLLIEQGADVNATTDRLWTPLHLAAHYNSNERIVRLLIGKGADIHTRCDAGWTPLHHACRSNANDQVTSLLLSKGCDVNALTARGWTPLHHAAEGTTNPKIVRLLLRYGAEIDAEDDIGWTALHHAARCCTEVEITRILIEEQANVKAMAKDRTTPLHQAAGFNSNPQVVRLLIEHNAAVNGRTTKGAIPLHIAAYNNPNIEILDQLMDESNVNATDPEQMTPLHAAAMNNSNAYIVTRLLEKTADINAIDKNRWTPLHHAINRANLDVVSTLIQAGADVNAQTSEGETPLKLATRLGFLDAVGLLWSVGADESDAGQQLVALWLAAK